MSAVFRSGGATPLFLPAGASAAFRSFRSRTPPLLPSSSIQRRFSQTKPSEDAIQAAVKELERAGLERNEAEALVDGMYAVADFYKSITERNLEQLRRNLDSDASMRRSKLDSMSDRLTWLESTANELNKRRIANERSIIVTAAGAAGVVALGAGVVYAKIELIRD